jgi:hypothetical protein
MLLPRELDMVEAGKQMPLPLPKPAITEEPKKTKMPAKKAPKRGAPAATVKPQARPG